MGRFMVGGKGAVPFLQHVLRTMPWPRPRHGPIYVDPQ
jgi:hypothetical protein